MGAFEDFVNANLGVRMPLYIDTTTPDLSAKAAGSLGSKYVDSSTNFLYEKTGFTNADWVKIAELGDSRGGGGGSIDISGGYNITIDEVGSTYIVNFKDPLTGTFRVQDSEIIGTGNGIPFAVSESGQVGLNLFTGENQVTGFVTPYHFHVSGATALSGTHNLKGDPEAALTVVGDTELVEGAFYVSPLTNSERNALSLRRDGSGALIFNTDSNQLQLNDGISWRTLSGGALGSGVGVVANIGAGSGIASGVVDDTAFFKSLIGGTNLQISVDATSLTLNVTGISGGSTTGITGATNLGAGSGLISGITDNDLQVKSLVGGTNLQITGDGESLYLNVTGVSGSTVSGITGASNIGNGSGVLSGISDNELVFRTLEAGPNVFINTGVDGSLSISASTTNVTVTGGSVSGGIGANPYVTGKSNFYTELPDEIIIDRSVGDQIYKFELNSVSSSFNQIYYTINSLVSSDAVYTYRVTNNAEGTYEGFFPSNPGFSPTLSLSGMIESGRAVYLGGGGSGSSSSTTGITGIESLGAGSALASGVSGSDLYLKSLVGGTNVTLSSDDNTITINAAGGGGGGGGSSSGSAFSNNARVSGWSNFYTIVPDALVLEDNGGNTGIFTVNQLLDSENEIYYENRYEVTGPAHKFISFKNTSSGEVGTYNQGVSTSVSSLSGLIDDDRAMYYAGGGGGSGSSSSTTGITGATNLGAGSGLISGITDNDLQVKSLVGGTNLQITGDDESLYLNVTGVSGSTVSGITGASNIGTGSGVFSGISDNDLVFRTIEAGPNVFITESSSGLKISSTTTNVTVTGGSVSGGVGSNPYITGKSNFTGVLPDSLVMDYAPTSAYNIWHFTWIDASDIYYRLGDLTTSPKYIYFNNDNVGSFDNYINTTATQYGAGKSLTQFIADGQAVYLGGGGSSSSSSSTTGITGATNLGAGSGLISGVTNNDLQVKSLVGGTNLQITGDGESLYLNVTGVSGSTVSGITGASNIGTGSGVFSGISDNDLVFRTIQAGPNVTIDEVGSGLRITASTTNITVTGGTVSGGLGSNPFITGASNFYTTLPDQVILSAVSNNAPDAFSLYFVSPTLIYYHSPVLGSDYFIAFNNNSAGDFDSYVNTSASAFGAGQSLSGYISSGRGVYLGGGGSGSSSSSTTGITGVESLGAGSALASGVSGSDLYLKSLVGGTNVTLSSDDNTITINASAGGGGGGGGGGSGGAPVVQSTYVGDGASTGIYIPLDFTPVEVQLHSAGSSTAGGPYYGKTTLLLSNSGQQSIYTYGSPPSNSRGRGDMGTISGQGFLAKGSVNDSAFNVNGCTYHYVAIGSGSGGGSSSDPDCTGCGIPVSSTFTGRMPRAIIADYYYNGGAIQYKLQMPFLAIGSDSHIYFEQYNEGWSNSAGQRLILKFNDDAAGTVDTVSPSAGTYYFPNTTRTLSDYIASGDVIY